LAAWLIGAALFEGRVSAGKVDLAEVVVLPGDTLWDIAGRYGPPGSDIRETVYRIRKANGLQTSVLQPGQVLAVPRSR
jgi:LysM repeat protein